MVKRSQNLSIPSMMFLGNAPKDFVIISVLIAENAAPTFYENVHQTYENPCIPEKIIKKYQRVIEQKQNNDHP